MCRRFFRLISYKISKFVNTFLKPSLKKLFLHPILLKGKKGYVAILLSVAVPTLIYAVRYAMDSAIFMSWNIFTKESDIIYKKCSTAVAYNLALYYNPYFSLSSQVTDLYIIATSIYDKYPEYHSSIVGRAIDGLERIDKFNKKNLKVTARTSLNGKSEFSIGARSKSCNKYTLTIANTTNPYYGLYRYVDLYTSKMTTPPRVMLWKYEPNNALEQKFILNMDIFLTPMTFTKKNETHETRYPKAKPFSQYIKSEDAAYVYTSAYPTYAKILRSLTDDSTAPTFQYSSASSAKFSTFANDFSDNNTIGVTSKKTENVATQNNFIDADENERESLKTKAQNLGLDISLKNDVICVKTRSFEDTGSPGGKTEVAYAAPAECNVDIVLSIPTNEAACNKYNQDEASEVYNNNTNLETIVKTEGQTSDAHETPIYQVAQGYRYFLRKHFFHTKGVNVGIVPYSGKISLSPDRKKWTTNIPPFDGATFVKDVGDFPRMHKPYIRSAVLYGTKGLKGAQLKQSSGFYSWGGNTTLCPIMFRRGVAYEKKGDDGETTGEKITCGGNIIWTGDIISSEEPNTEAKKFLRMNPNPCYFGCANLLSMKCDSKCVTYLPNPYYVIELTPNVQRVYEILGTFYPFQDPYNVSNFTFLPIVWANNLFQNWTADFERLSTNDQTKIESKRTTGRKKVVILVVNKPDFFEAGELTHLGFNNDYSEISMSESDKIDFAVNPSEGYKGILKCSKDTGSATLTFPQAALVKIVVDGSGTITLDTKDKNGKEITKTENIKERKTVYVESWELRDGNDGGKKLYFNYTEVKIISAEITNAVQPPRLEWDGISNVIYSYNGFVPFTITTRAPELSATLIDKGGADPNANSSGTNTYPYNSSKSPYGTYYFSYKSERGKKIKKAKLTCMFGNNLSCRYSVNNRYLNWYAGKEGSFDEGVSPYLSATQKTRIRDIGMYCTDYPIVHYYWEDEKRWEWGWKKKWIFWVWMYYHYWVKVQKSWTEHRYKYTSQYCRFTFSEVPDQMKANLSWAEHTSKTYSLFIFRDDGTLEPTCNGKTAEFKISNKYINGDYWSKNYYRAHGYLKWVKLKLANLNGSLSRNGTISFYGSGDLSVKIYGPPKEKIPTFFIDYATGYTTDNTYKREGTVAEFTFDQGNGFKKANGDTNYQRSVYIDPRRYYYERESGTNRFKIVVTLKNGCKITEVKADNKNAITEIKDPNAIDKPAVNAFTWDGAGEIITMNRQLPVVLTVSPKYSSTVSFSSEAKNYLEDSKNINTEIELDTYKTVQNDVSKTFTFNFPRTIDSNDNTGSGIPKDKLTYELTNAKITKITVSDRKIHWQGGKNEWNDEGCEISDSSNITPGDNITNSENQGTGGEVAQTIDEKSHTIKTQLSNVILEDESNSNSATSENISKDSSYERGRITWKFDDEPSKIIGTASVKWMLNQPFFPTTQENIALEKYNAAKNQLNSSDNSITYKLCYLSPDFNNKGYENGSIGTECPTLNTSLSENQKINYMKNRKTVEMFDSSGNRISKEEGISPSITKRIKFLNEKISAYKSCLGNSTLKTTVLNFEEKFKKLYTSKRAIEVPDSYTGDDALWKYMQNNPTNTKVSAYKDAYKAIYGVFPSNASDIEKTFQSNTLKGYNSTSGLMKEYNNAKKTHHTSWNGICPTYHHKGLAGEGLKWGTKDSDAPSGGKTYYPEIADKYSSISYKTGDHGKRFTGTDWAKIDGIGFVFKDKNINKTQQKLLDAIIKQINKTYDLSMIESRCDDALNSAKEKVKSNSLPKKIWNYLWNGNDAEYVSLKNNYKDPSPNVVLYFCPYCKAGIKPCYYNTQFCDKCFDISLCDDLIMLYEELAEAESSLGGLRDDLSKAEEELANTMLGFYEKAGESATEIYYPYRYFAKQNEQNNSGNIIAVRKNGNNYTILRKTTEKDDGTLTFGSYIENASSETPQQGDSVATKQFKDTDIVYKNINADGNGNLGYITLNSTSSNSNLLKIFAPSSVLTEIKEDTEWQNLETSLTENQYKSFAAGAVNTQKTENNINISACDILSVFQTDRYLNGQRFYSMDFTQSGNFNIENDCNESFSKTTNSGNTLIVERSNGPVSESKTIDRRYSYNVPGYGGANENSEEYGVIKNDRSGTISFCGSGKVTVTVEPDPAPYIDIEPASNSSAVHKYEFSTYYEQKEGVKVKDDDGNYKVASMLVFVDPSKFKYEPISGTKNYRLKIKCHNVAVTSVTAMSEEYANPELSSYVRTVKYAGGDEPLSITGNTEDGNNYTYLKANYEKNAKNNRFTISIWPGDANLIANEDAEGNGIKSQTVSGGGKSISNAKIPGMSRLFFPLWREFSNTSYVDINYNSAYLSLCEFSYPMNAVLLNGYENKQFAVGWQDPATMMNGQDRAESRYDQQYALGLLLQSAITRLRSDCKDKNGDTVRIYVIKYRTQKEYYGLPEKKSVEHLYQYIDAAPKDNSDSFLTKILSTIGISKFVFEVDTENDLRKAFDDIASDIKQFCGAKEARLVNSPNAR